MFSNKVVEIGVWWELCTHNYYYLPPRLNVNQNKAILQGVVYVCMSFTLVPFRLTKFCFGQNVWMSYVKWVMKQIVNKFNELLNALSKPFTYSDISSNESSRFRWVVKWIFNQNFQTNLISQGPSVSCRLLELWPSLEWDAADCKRGRRRNRITKEGASSSCSGGGDFWNLLIGQQTTNRGPRERNLVAKDSKSYKLHFR